MEKINRHNYEAYFLDFIEGNLSAEEQHDLQLFLLENPDLKNQLDIDFDEVILSATPIDFENKEELKVADYSILNLNSVEFWMIESVEKNLNQDQENALQEFVKKHKLDKEYLAFSATRLQADATEVFEEKQRLKVNTGLVIPLYYRVAAVAAIGIVLISIAVNSSLFNSVSSTNNLDFASMGKLEIPKHHGVIIEDANGIIKNDNIANAPISNQNKKDNAKENNEENNFVAPDNLISHQDNNNIKDTSLVPLDNDEKIANNFPKDTLVDETPEDVAVYAGPQIKSEQPYKIITDAASNFTKQEIYFSRDKNVESNQYVAYQFKLGKFEFERKKSE